VEVEMFKEVVRISKRRFNIMAATDVVGN
jgi:hypothetical protein